MRHGVCPRRTRTPVRNRRSTVLSAFNRSACDIRADQVRAHRLVARHSASPSRSGAKLSGSSALRQLSQITLSRMLGDKIVRGPGVVDCPPQQPVLPSLGRRADRVGQERGRWVNKPLPGACLPVIMARETVAPRKRRAVVGSSRSRLCITILSASIRRPKSPAMAVGVTDRL